MDTKLQPQGDNRFIAKLYQIIGQIKQLRKQIDKPSQEEATKLEKSLVIGHKEIFTLLFDLMGNTDFEECKKGKTNTL